MRNAVIALIVGIVVGVVTGASLVAPRIAALTAGAAADGAAARGTAAGEGTAPVDPATAAPPIVADDPAPVRWRMTSAFPGALPQAGALAKRVESEIRRVSAGAFEIGSHEPGDPVAPDALLDAVSEGGMDAAYVDPAMWSARAPALRLFGSVPFGPIAREYLAWIHAGGGAAIADGILRRNNTHGIVCGVATAQASGWFRRQVRAVDDLDGLRMRIDGLGGKVMRRLGVEPVALEGGDIFHGFETGAIDAAEHATPATDLRLGLDRFARHYYFPGWQRPATLYFLLVNRDRWNALDGARRAQIGAVCGDTVRHGLAEGEAAQLAALKEIEAKGVAVRRWPPAVLEAIEAAWREVAADEAGADAEFGAAWASLQAFRRDYALWRDLVGWSAARAGTGGGATTRHAD